MSSVVFLRFVIVFEFFFFLTRALLDIQASFKHGYVPPTSAFCYHPYLSFLGDMKLFRQSHVLLAFHILCLACLAHGYIWCCMDFWQVAHLLRRQIKVCNRAGVMV